MPGAGTTGVLTKRPRPINAWGSSAGWRDGALVGHLVLPVPTHVLSADQLSRLASQAGRYRSLVLVLGVGGLRWGEAAALRVSEIEAEVRARQRKRLSRPTLWSTRRGSFLTCDFLSPSPVRESEAVLGPAFSCRTWAEVPVSAARRDGKESS